MKFKLKARVSRSDVPTVEHVLQELGARGSVTRGADDIVVEAEVEGGSAKELNRSLLSALRKAQKRTTLRAEWRSSDNTTEKYFDYVLKKTTTDGTK